MSAPKTPAEVASLDQASAAMDRHVRLFVARARVQSARVGHEQAGADLTTFLANWDELTRVSLAALCARALVRLAEVEGGDPR